MTLSSHERIMRIFKNQEVDRPALKLWGASLDPWLLHPAYGPIHRLALEKSDLFVGAGSPFNMLMGRYAAQYCEQRDEPVAEGWLNRHTYFHTPKGDLHQLERVSTLGEPGYTLEHAVKEPEDIEKLLSLPYEPFPFQAEPYHETVRAVGERGVAMFALDHPGFTAQSLIGSENMAYFSIDAREQLHELITVFGARVRAHVRAALENGIRGPFSWVGPEVLIPPLMSHRDFEEFVFDIDKPFCDDIHNAGGYVWVHCHGKVANLVPRFIEMGVDILNPLEPPPNGDILLDQAVARHGRSIGWEGNIEIQTLLQSDPETVRAEVYRCAQVGKQINRFVLCPSAGYMEYTHPDENYLQNLALYLNYGLECLET